VATNSPPHIAEERSYPQRLRTRDAAAAMPDDSSHVGRKNVVSEMPKSRKKT
jgi:hypothetical protein